VAVRAARVADVEEAQAAGFRVGDDARGRGGGGAGVAAVDDDGFVGESCERQHWSACCPFEGKVGVEGCGGRTVVDGRGFMLGAQDFEPGFHVTRVTACAGWELNGCSHHEEL